MASRTPDGIADEALTLPSGRGRANPIPLLILTALMLVALFGVLGGQSDPVRRAESGAAVIEVRAPEVLRNGMVFETIVDVIPKQPVKELVIALSDGLWREMTINAMVPAAGEEGHEDGMFRFSFGKAEAGKSFRFKIDGQINPPLVAGTKGQIVILDGHTPLVELPIAMKVRP